jgi:hypothetical protein
MTPPEKYLCNQNHPAKLLTDWITGVIALYVFWRHHFVAALATALIPPAILPRLKQISHAANKPWGW